MNRSVLLVPVFLLALTGCSDQVGSDPVPGISFSARATADMNAIAQRWNDMTDEEQAAVCAAASGPLPGEGEVGGASSPGSPDYRLMMEMLMKPGYSQADATAMIPYALFECR